MVSRTASADLWAPRRLSQQYWGKGDGVFARFNKLLATNKTVSLRSILNAEPWMDNQEKEILHT